MKKFLAFISAILLALLATAGILAWRGVDLSELSFKSLFQKNENRDHLPNLPSNITPPDEDPNLSYEERMEKGDYYLERGFLTFASNEYIKAANLEPERIDPYLKLLKTHLELRNYEQALANVESILTLNPNHFETRFNKALIYIKLSQFDQAKELLYAFPAPESDQPKILYYKGLLDALFGAHDAASQALNIARDTSTDTQLTDQIATVLEAYREFNFTQEAEPIYLSELLARSFNKVGEYEMAIHLLKDTLKTRGDLRDGWILLGFAYLNLEKYQFAQTAFDKAYSLDSEWPTTQYFLGITHKELGQVQDAITFFSLALANDFQPELVVQRHLADLYFEAQQYEKSAEAYEKVLAMSKDDVNSFVRPVWLYIDFIKEPQKALKLAETAALTFPNSAMSYNLVGWSYIGLGDEKKAESNLKKAIEIDPNLAAAHFNIGQLYETQNRNQLALEAYQEAYNLDSNGSIGNLAAQAYNELLKETISE